MADIEVRAGAAFRSVGLPSIAQSPPPDQDRLLAHVHAGTAWVAGSDGDIVGYAIASVVDGDGHLDQVSVVPEAQGRGIGRMLVDAVLAWSRAEGHHGVTLTTFVDVPWNGPWYERLGFQFLPEGQLGPELRDIRSGERETGLDLQPRAAMRRTVRD